MIVFVGHSGEQDFPIATRVKEVCAEHKHINALLLKERQAIQVKEVQWTEEKKCLNQLIHTANDQLNKCMAELRLAKAERDQRQASPGHPQAERPTLSSQPSIPPPPGPTIVMPAQKRALESQKAISKRRKRQRKAASDRTCSEPITLAAALEFVPPPPSKVVGHLIVLSSDDDQEEQEVPPVLPCPSLQLNTSEGDELLPTMMSPPAISPPKIIQAADKVVDQGNAKDKLNASSSACAIEQLETLTKRLESEMPVFISQQSAATATRPALNHSSKTAVLEPLTQIQPLVSGSPLPAIPQLTAQHFADYVAQSNQISGRGALNVRLEHGDLRVQASVSQAQQSQHTRQLFVDFLKLYAKYIPAWSAVIPFCERYGVPTEERAQLVLQLQPIADKFEEMKYTAGQYFFR